ncbi:S8 family serine peptidase [Caldalkalibacillus thermarum TA2.A1]|uniref:S8 family serine peptidase n=1 Tax=Caldalkalibacillus thermarum (strain TA2.A1) TaxID=986075 RepID=A0A8X8LAK7_CALTT|nr:S8 family serine peptidase [Caldalkalibacillus thermarum]QZT34058.1 S8 family serine peptidase [Caldalkalibacillus thermarum TA2.A1]
MTGKWGAVLLVIALLFTYIPSATANEQGDLLDRLAPLYGSYDLFSRSSVTVIVEIESPSLVEAKHLGISQTQGYLASKRQHVINHIQAEIPSAKIGTEYEYLFSGMAVTLPANAIPKLLVTPGVRAVYPNVTYSVDMNLDKGLIYQFNPEIMDSPSLRGLERVREQWGYTGKDVKVAVVDTGVDYTHPDLKNAFGEYKGWDFVDNNDDPQETAAGNPGGEATTHGTHIAGIIAADGDLSGIAPEVTLLAYRVIGPGGSGTTERVLAALDRAVQDEADIINLSLSGEQPDWALGKAIHWAQAENAIVITSVEMHAPVDPATLGDDNPLPPVVVGTLPLTAIEYGADFDFSGQVQLKNIDVIGYRENQDVNKLAEGNYDIAYVAFNDVQEIRRMDLKGQIAVMSDKQLPIIDYVKALDQAGAEAVIIYMTEEEPQPLVIPGLPLPTFAISYEEAVRIYQAMREGKDQISVNLKQIQVSDESWARSKDDQPGSHPVKPDLLAPGQRIISTIATHQLEAPHGYAAAHGAQISAAHVSGAVALLLEAGHLADERLMTDEMKDLLFQTADRQNDLAFERGEITGTGSDGARLDLWEAVKQLKSNEDQADHDAQAKGKDQAGQNDGTVLDVAFHVKERGASAFDLELELNRPVDLVQFWVFSETYEYMGAIDTYVAAEGQVRIEGWNGVIEQQPLPEGTYYVIAYIEHHGQSEYVYGGAIQLEKRNAERASLLHAPRDLALR